MVWDREMQRALEADGEKLRQLTGEDHGPFDVAGAVTHPVDWHRSPPFITSLSGDGKYEVSIKVHSIEELHAAHDLVLKAFSDARSDLLARRIIDANQG